MAKYTVELSDEVEEFLDMYFIVRPLRPEHKRADYPNLVVNNFIKSALLPKKDKYLEDYYEKTGKRYAGENEEFTGL